VNIINSRAVASEVPPNGSQPSSEMDMHKSKSSSEANSVAGHLLHVAPGPHRRGLALIGLVMGLAITAAACSSTPAASGSTTTTQAATTTGSSTTSTPASTTGALSVASGKAGSVGTVLTGPNGHTLYELTTEKNGKIECTGSCAQAWPPLVVSSGQSAKLDSGLEGTLGTVTRPEGTTQVTYNGHPLYYYAADSASGQANGQGVDGIWFAMKPGSSDASSTGPTTSTTSGGYSY
jgi:predicted lipoprotein with Yx(FWY)xxD motif